MKIGRTLLVLGLVVGVAGCDAFGEGTLSNSDVLARAAGHVLSVQDAAGLLSGQSQLPNQPEVVEALGDLWIDYTLLAEAAAKDSLLENVDLRPLVRQQMEQEMVYRLREQVIQPDTAISEEELRQLFEEEAPGVRVRARHILLNYPDQATPEQRDSVQALAGDLRRRLLEGADFAELAAEYSEDTGSARNGGDLGFFTREEMVRPFADAAFALEPGEISEPVETQFGLHVIRVEERETPEFEETRQQFAGQIRSRRIARAESVYIAGLEEPADVRIAEGAYEAVRGIARRPGQDLTRRAGNRPLTEYEGGAYTVGEFQEYIQGRPPANRGQIAEAGDEALEGFLRNLTRGELLVTEAREAGLEPAEEEQDSLLVQARNRFVAAARQLELHDVTPEEGQSLEQAIDEAVLARLRDMLQGSRDVIPLGTISYSLRRAYASALFESAVPRVVAAVEEARTAPATGPGTAPSTPAPQAPQRAPNAPPAAADTTG